MSWSSRLGNRRIDRAQARWCVVGALDQQRERRVSTARSAFPDEHLRENQAERVDVGALVDGLSGRLFGRHVRQRSDDRAGRRGKRAGVGRTSDPEVGDDRLLGVVDEDVGGLEIAVHDASLVRGAKARHDLTGERQHPGDRQLALGSEQTREIGAVDERHRDVLDAVDLAHVVDTDHVGMRDLPREHELALEPALQLLRGERIRIRLDHLERERQPQLGIPDVINGTHPTNAEQADDLVALAKGLARDEAHGSPAGGERVHEGRSDRLGVGSSGRARDRAARRRQQGGRDTGTRQRCSANGAAFR